MTCDKCREFRPDGPLKTRRDRDWGGNLCGRCWLNTTPTDTKTAWQATPNTARQSWLRARTLAETA